MKGWRDWLWVIIGLLVIDAVTRWILAPSLDLVPAYVLFGGLFLVAVFLTWWKVLRGERAPLKAWAFMMLIFSLMWGGFTLILYSSTMRWRAGDNSSGWALAGAACLGILALIAWLGNRGDKSEGGAPTG